MAKKNNSKNKDKNRKDRAEIKKKFKKTNPDFVVVKEDDLRELVTETVTKLMAEDVLDMDDDGIIDLKSEVELKKKAAKHKKKEE